MDQSTPATPAPPSKPTVPNFFRNWLALIIIAVAVLGIIVTAYCYITLGDPEEAPERAFTAILPLLATWVGTVLAFYFGRENFEAASNRYEQIIQKLTPEILDDVTVGQIMISKRTMVCLDIDVAKKKGVKRLVEFLNVIDKNRLPVMEDDKLKYIIHKSSFLEALNKVDNADISFDDFVKAYETKITTAIYVPQTAVLEKVMEQLKEQKLVRDVFIVDESDKVLGWLTDTLIMRYVQTRLRT